MEVFHEAASKVLAQGLIDLGILECSLEEALGEDFNGLTKLLHAWYRTSTWSRCP